MAGREHGDVVALSVDLMDRSKISGAIDGVRLVRSVAALAAADDAAVLVVDLARVSDMDALASLTGERRVIAYGSHVDEEQLAAAERAGAEALPRSVFFRRLSEGTLL